MTIFKKKIGSRIVAILLAAFMLLTMLPIGLFTTFAVGANETWLDIGRRQPVLKVNDNKVIISTPEELARFAWEVTNPYKWDYNEHRGQSIKIVADIDMTGHKWIAMSDYDKGLLANIDGQKPDGTNAKISGLDIENSFYDREYINNYIGFIANISSSCSVSNLTLVSPTVSGWDKLGSLAGQNRGSISNVRVEGGTITQLRAHYGYIFGGLVGTNFGNVNNCFSSAAVIIVKDCGARAGGLIGDSRNGSVTNNIVVGTLPVIGFPDTGMTIVKGNISDNSAPIINSVATSSTDWTKDDVTLTVDASDTESGIKEYSFDNGVTWQTANTKTYTTTMNSEISVIAKNKADMESVATKITVKIDKVAPKINNITVSPDTSNQAVIVTLNATDIDSGLNTNAYSFDNGVTWQTANSISVSPTKKFEIDEIQVKDKVGNITKHGSIFDVADDKEYPSYTSITGNPTTWTANDVTLSINGAVNSARPELADKPYSFDDGVTWQINNTKTYTRNTSGIIIRIKDKAGRVTTAPAIDITKIDKTVPTISATGDTTTTTLQSDKPTIVPTVGISGISKIEVIKDAGSWTDITSTYNTTYAISSNGLYIFKVTNGAGVSAQSNVLVYMNFDKIIPVVEINSHGYRSTSWTNAAEIILDITNSNTSSVGNIRFQYSTDGINYTDFAGRMVIDTDINYTTYYFKAISSSGTESEVKKFSVCRDTVAPTDVKVTYSTNHFKKIVNFVTFGLFYKDYVTVTINANDALSGVEKYQYKTVDINGNVITDWKEIKNSNFFRISADFSGKVYGRVIDYAGNKSVNDNEIGDSDTTTGTPIVINDKQANAPTITTNGYTPGSFTKEDVVITLSGSTILSKIEKYQYKKGLTGSWTDMPESTNTQNSETNGQFIVDKLTLNADTNETFYFRAISNTGVEGVESNCIIKVQKTTPDNANVVISPLPDGTNDWYKTNYPTITLTKPNNTITPTPSATITTYYKLWNTLNGQTEPTTATVFNGSNQPVITDDGVYQLKVWTEDITGNKCKDIYTKEIKIDKVAPENLAITYDKPFLA
ncbi:MAG: hypothetical protein RR436_04285, partial [Clostridia bacterium]